VRAPVEPATRWMRVVSIASARLRAGRMVVNQRASLDGLTPGRLRKMVRYATGTHVFAGRRRPRGMCVSSLVQWHAVVAGTDRRATGPLESQRLLTRHQGTAVGSVPV
jgi:hypothetical protein